MVVEDLYDDSPHVLSHITFKVIICVFSPDYFEDRMILMRLELEFRHEKPRRGRGRGGAYESD